MTPGEEEMPPAESAAEDAQKEEAELPPEEILLEGLFILPPRQKTTGDKVQHAVALPPLRSEEPVQSLRGALSEVIGYAHMTNYRFEVCDKPANVTTGNVPLISPYSGSNAVIATPLAAETLCEESSKTSENCLDEYGNLVKLTERENPASFEIVLERYDVASIKDHVTRLRSLMQGNVPSVESLVDEDDEEKQKESSEEKKEDIVGDLRSTSVKSVAGNLQDFFYRVNGEDPETYQLGNKLKQTSNGSKKKKKRGPEEEIPSKESLFAEKVKRWNELDDKMKMPYAIRYSGYHPPPSSRRWLGDLAYLELIDLSQDASLNGSSTCVSVTATTTGFYVNNSKPNQHFDPSPNAQPCFSHSLLDCLLQASPKFSQAWAAAVEASKERSAVLKSLNKDPLLSFFRIAARADFGGFKLPNSSFQQALDGALVSPSWIVPKIPLDSWHNHQLHPYNITKAEEDLNQTYGIDLRNGGIRDWNEELQMAREMPTETLTQRLERARMLHKVLTEFGEASLLGVKAIVDGHIAPMNPNETARAQVFLHNNIFFSRAIDSGPETFKWHKGDAAARKAANRDLSVISTISRTEKSGLCTLGTVLIDFLGTRYVCQSILPGILIGERSHTLLYGAVETGSPLKFDEELHETIKGFIGEGMMLASRPVYRIPVTSERLEEVQKLKENNPFYQILEKKEEEEVNPDATIATCIPIEAKGIMGSDKRKYLLDLGRLTPRDANWVSASEGGTGKFEGLQLTSNIPSTLQDDEWTVHVLRPELVTRFTQTKMARYLALKKEAADSESKKSDDEVSNEKSNDNTLSEIKEQEKTDASEENAQSETIPSNSEEKDTQDSRKLTEEDEAYAETLKLNINVFMPHMKKFEGDLAEQIKKDEQLVREAAEFLWDETLPRITRGVKDGSLHPVPMDGKTLTEFIHRQGINCRYLGRLATLAKEEEARDEQTEAELKEGTLPYVERRSMPKCWLELLECEIVARAAKHVLDRYFKENAGIASTQPSQTIASFLSSLVSEREETAAQTETRLEKRTLGPDEEEFDALTITDTGGRVSGGGSSMVRGRFEVWIDIEQEVGRRFRYNLSLFNKGNKSGRALHIPLLRRFCQRAGIRLYAKNYDVGKGCLCGGGNNVSGLLLESYPISPLDIVDIVPLMKHSSAYGEGFEPCSVGATISLPPLQVALPDARFALQRAHLMMNGRALSKAVDLAQEAASLYQRVTESPTHPGVVESMELLSNIFLEAGDVDTASSNEAKALTLCIQGSGFDSPRVFASHMSLFQMNFAAKRIDQAIKHAHAALYILELMAGPRHTEVFSIYHRLGSIYSSDDLKGKYNTIALAMLEEADKRGSCDRLMDGIAAKSHAKVHAGLKNFEAAAEAERKSYQVFTLFLGKDHQLTKESEIDLINYSKLAIRTKVSKVSGEKIREEEAIANAVAAELVAEEEQKMKKTSKKKKGKK
jgi:protein TIF31